MLVAWNTGYGNCSIRTGAAVVAIVVDDKLDVLRGGKYRTPSDDILPELHTISSTFSG